MEPRRQKRLTVGALTLTLALALTSRPGLFQSALPFYDVDKEIRVEGTVADLRLEPRYKDRAPFLVLVLEEPTTGRTYIVEVSPTWFLETDIHKGERLKVLGSLTGTSTVSGNILAREIQCRGETIVVRDRNGFPNWSGGRAGAGQGQRRKRGAAG